MQILFYAGMLIVSFICLIKGADFLVDGASAVAKALKIPAVIIGLTIVAFGTSAPEAGVSITSSIKGMNALSISNVVGSNVFNILVVVGCCAAIKAFKVDEEIRKRDYPLCILFTVLLVAFSFDRVISRLEGIILFVLIVGYVVLLVSISMRSSKLEVSVDNDGKADEKTKMTGKKVVWNLLKIVLSVGVIYLSSQGITTSCSYFAKIFGVSDTIIGLTIVALGTSLPELVTSIAASRKGESGIAIGNVVGSNIFNILFVLGVSAAISPVGNLSRANVYDTFICLAITLIVFAFVFIGKNLKRPHGFIMLLMYIVYMVFVFLREFQVINI